VSRVPDRLEGPETIEVSGEQLLYFFEWRISFMGGAMSNGQTKRLAQVSKN
jgi:hypothetical protein